MPEERDAIRGEVGTTVQVAVVATTAAAGLAVEVEVVVPVIQLCQAQCTRTV
jgi:hypothetical protein